MREARLTDVPDNAIKLLNLGPGPRTGNATDSAIRGVQHDVPIRLADHSGEVLHDWIPCVHDKGGDVATVAGAANQRRRDYRGAPISKDRS